MMISSNATSLRTLRGLLKGISICPSMFSRMLLEYEVNLKFCPENTEATVLVLLPISKGFLLLPYLQHIFMAEVTKYEN